MDKTPPEQVKSYDIFSEVGYYILFVVCRAHAGVHHGLLLVRAAACPGVRCWLAHIRLVLLLVGLVLHLGAAGPRKLSRQLRLLLAEH